MNSKEAILYILSRQNEYVLIQENFLIKLKQHFQTQDALSTENIFDFLKELNHESLVSKIMGAIDYKKLVSLDNKMTSEIQFCIYGEKIYPKEFYHLVDPPLIFSYIGSCCWNSFKIAVVGSREPSTKSVQWLQLFLHELIRDYPCATVSGGAIGVDQLAHIISVKGKTPTISILPSGLLNIYPNSIDQFKNKIILGGGCLISEFYPFEEVRKYHFNFRNRLIAALNQSIVIVEAREKSGTLITAHWALEFGKDVFVVPGHPLDPQFKGSNELIKLGAQVLSRREDIDFIRNLPNY